jgi:hypothetical protein
MIAYTGFFASSEIGSPEADHSRRIPANQGPWNIQRQLTDFAVKLRSSQCLFRVTGGETMVIMDETLVIHLSDCEEKACATTRAAEATRRAFQGTGQSWSIAGSSIRFRLGEPEWTMLRTDARKGRCHTKGPRLR